MQAIVMAGGKGTRLLPYTAVMPKPLMPIGDAPVLERLLRQLGRAGLRRICLAVLHHRQLIQAYFGDGRSLGLEISYAIEDHPLGTCGPVSQVIDAMEPDFLLLNADLFTDLGFAALLASHREKSADATVALQRRLVTQEFGVADVDEQGRITALREKPTAEHHLVMGVYALRREAIRPWLRPGQRLDMPELLDRMLLAGLKVDGFARDCVWLDIGRPEDYARAQEMALNPEPAVPGRVARIA
ncbi:nucleotidyltransferase family protein [Roseomonas eburnea]|uniref:Nucleotidyltransferase family protein n=1 Tax=Neoroseomonas eburnea TaxID=1346889 RepID=A0A9X9XCY6_9PROT|nr:nucleotidyltransferase family protein [Neoroseomonas eburnea]